MNPVGVTHGAALDDDIYAAYQDLVFQRKAAVTFKFNQDDSKVVVDETSVMTSSCHSPYQQTLDSFTDDNCKYVSALLPQ